MKAAKVCQMREAFLAEWRRTYTSAPIPVLESIGDIRENVVIDESNASGHILAVKENLSTVDDEIKQLVDEIRSKLFLKKFLIGVLGELDESESSQQEQLTKVRSQIVDINSLQEDWRVLEQCNDNSGGSVPVNGGKGHSAKVTVSKRTFHNQECGTSSEVKESDSVKFVSRINVNGGTDNIAVSPRSQSPAEQGKHGINTQCYDDKSEDSRFNSSSNNLTSSQEESEMFKRKKSNAAKPHEDGSHHHNLGSKDNFLAVSSKHILPSDIPRHNEGVTNSPQLPRHYQMLKMTSGFGLVLGDSNNSDNDTNDSNCDEKRPDNIDSSHGSLSSEYDGNSPIIGGAKNRKGDTDDVKPSPFPRGHEDLTLQMRDLNFNQDEDIADKEENTGKAESEHSAEPRRTLDTGSPDSQKRDRFTTQPCVSRSSPHHSADVIHDSKDSHRNPDPTRQNLRPARKAPVPPPVAKKPARPGSGKKSPPPPGAKPVVGRGEESRPRNSWGKDFHNKEGDSFNSPNDSSGGVDGRSRFSGEIQRSVSSDYEADPDRDYSHVSHSVHHETKFSVLRDKSKPQPPVPLLNELKSKCDSRLSTVDSDLIEESATGNQEINTQGDKNIHLSKSPVHVQSDHRHSSSDNVDVLGESTPRETSETDFYLGDNSEASDMSNYKLPKNFDGRRKRNSIGELVDSTVGTISKIVERQSANFGGNDDSMSEAPIKEANMDLDETSQMSTGSDKGDYDRMISCSSSDTLVNEYDRKLSTTSDSDVREALGNLDIVVQSEIPSIAEHPSEDSSSRKRLSSTPNYENWTINRAVTRPMTHEYGSVSDDDELDEISSSSTSASPCLKRQGDTKGSKDSGLCDDINAVDGPSMTDADLASGRVRDLRALQYLGSVEESEINELSEEIYQDKDMDDISVASSDFEYRRGSDRSHNARESVVSRESMDRESLDTISQVSSGEDDTNTTMDSSYDEADSPREGMLKMRQLVVKGVLDSEKIYLGILSTLIYYKRNLEMSSTTSQPVISKSDIEIIFSNIETIHEIQTEFVHDLEPKVKEWSHATQIGETFTVMIQKFEKFANYLTNYQQAVSTIHKCCHESEQFEKIVQQIKVSNATKEVTSLEDALFKPVQRLQRNTLVLHDLIKYTPATHPDHQALQNALKLSQQILEKFATTIPQHPTTQENRRLVKSSFLVELVNRGRKLRYMFLFSDVLVCTKRETHRNNKVSFEIKWFAPLHQTSIDTKTAVTEDTKNNQKEDVDTLKSKIKALKKELRLELRKYDDKDKHRSIVSLGGATRVVEKLQKKINTYEASLILNSPKLPFNVSLEGGKMYTLLMSTDYEREEWKETIASLCSRTKYGSAQPMGSVFVQELINGVKETPQINKIGTVLMQKDEDIFSGILNVTIHTINGLTEECDTYCCLEMDSFGHFFMKAKTHICKNTREPAWNEDFELVLEGSQTLRILCFKKQESSEGDKLLGRGALELSKSWLKGSFQEKTVSMNEISLVISVRHTPAEKTMQRTPSRSGSAVFGVKISSCARREGKTVPTIVTACIQEVEKRGLDETGIYRVSGVTSDLQAIKKLFDKNVKAGAAALQDADIHAVTGVLKLYFRELPEPLFTEQSYQSFVDTLKLSDEESKSRCMLALLHDLPDSNYYTIVSLLEHLIKVAKNVGENKMSIHNLSTVFGPTLLAPASKQTSNDPMELMCRGAEQVMKQSSVINYILGLAVSGRSLRRSANEKTS